MKYHGPTGMLTVSKDDLERATHLFYVAIAKIREANNLPYHPYEHGAWDDAYSMMSVILNAAKALGIELGGETPDQIDVSKFKD